MDRTAHEQTSTTPAGGLLPPGRPPTALASLFENIPPELRELRRFVLWRWKWAPGRARPWTKVPLRRGGMASSTNPDTWMSFDEARYWCELGFEDGEIPYDGIGFVFTADDDLIGLDLDHAIDPATGEFTAEAMAMAAAWPYAETSVSGTGIHCIGLGAMPDGKGRKAADVELYSQGRFFTLTGALIHPLEPMRDVQPEVDRLIAEMDLRAPAQGAPLVADTTLRVLTEAGPEEDDALLAKARGAPDGAKFVALFDLGAWQQFPEYPSQSEADLGLTRLLKFWTRGDTEHIDRLFRRSALMRPKWDEQHGALTYGAKTIGLVMGTRFGDGVRRAHDDGRLPRTVSPHSAPTKNAQVFLKEHYTDETGFCLLRCQNMTFHAYDGKCWPEIEEAIIRTELYEFFDDAIYPSGNSTRPFHPTGYLVSQILDAVRHQVSVFIPAATPVPAWLEGEGDAPAKELIAVANGRIHVPTRSLWSPTPRFYTHHVLPFSYEPAAPEPRRWLAFLDSVWPGDQESIDTLQEVFGYMISGEKRQEKIIAIIGPKRSGKGTIANVLRSLVGEHNAAAPTLTQLAETFGLESCLGKILGVISDARLDRPSKAIVERLLTISSRDAIDVNRKNKTAWTGVLPTRLLLLSNEVPRLVDESGALSSRFLLLGTKISFEDDPDTFLAEALAKELGGILNWSLVGLERLTERGRFVPPRSGADLRRTMESLSEPVRAFVEETCVVAPGREIKVTDLYQRWCAWCEANGMRVTDTAVFGANLAAAYRGKFTTARLGPRGSRATCYVGIGARDDDDEDVDCPLVTDDGWACSQDR